MLPKSRKQLSNKTKSYFKKTSQSFNTGQSQFKTSNNAQIAMKPIVIKARATTKDNLASSQQHMKRIDDPILH